jgi:CheY-like chemotaxis protein
MVRVVALIPDLLFGSRVQGQLVAAGHEVELVGDSGRVRERLAAAVRQEGDDAAAAVLVVDLTNPDLDGAALVRELNDDGTLNGMSTLGFFAHVDPAVRERALAAGFDQVVPRSRMAREGGALISRMIDSHGEQS